MAKKLSKFNKLRKVLTEVAVHAQDRFEQKQPCRMMELAFAKALDKKVAKAPDFAWRA